MKQNYIMDKLTLSDLKESGKVVIPNFQRGVVWTKQHRKEFIETVKSGDPFGVVLVSQETPASPYILIDGLQRLSTLKAYMANPLEYIDENDRFIDKDKLNDLFVEKYKALGLTLPSVAKLGKEKKSFLRKLLVLMKAEETLPDETDLWEEISAHIGISKDKFDVFTSFSKFYKVFVENLQLPDVIIHAIVYQGPKDRLPGVFETLNTSSVSLTKYEVFSSQWPSTKYVISDDELIKSVWSKYESLKASSAFEVDADIDSIREEGITLFEYCFGFSELVCLSGAEYEFLFTKGKKTTNPTGFELLALACGLAVNKADDLWKTDYLGNSNSEFLIQFKNSLMDAIKIVAAALKEWVLDMNNSYIKGVGAYQVYYMIVSVFNHKYKLDLDTRSISVKDTADSFIEKFKKYAYKWYLYQIITGFWNQNRQVSDLRKLLDSDLEGKEDMYYSDISKDTWKMALSSFEYETDNRTIPNELRLFMHYYYKMLIQEDANRERYFVRNTQEGEEIQFDIEHIVPYSRFAKNTDLARTSLGNLCYLPVKDNRSKREHTIYEYALDRPSLTYNQEFLDLILYPTREDLSFIDCGEEQFKDPYNRMIESRQERIIKKFIELMIGG